MKKGLLDLVGLDQGADESTLGEWLRAHTKESVLALHQVNRDFVRWALDQAAPNRVLHGGAIEAFFDDTEIEVSGKKIKGARGNYNGDLALSWQTLWVGPFLLDGILDGAGDVSEHLGVLLGEHAGLWQGRPSYFYANSSSSAAGYLGAIAQASFSRWSVRPSKIQQNGLQIISINRIHPFFGGCGTNAKDSGTYDQPGSTLTSLLPPNMVR